MYTCQRFSDSGVGVHCVSDRIEVQLVRVQGGISRRMQDSFLLGNESTVVTLSYLFERATVDNLFTRLPIAAQHVSHETTKT